MTGRRALGAALIVIGLLVAGIGASSLVSGPSPTPGPAASAAPSIVPTSPTPAASGTATPTPTPSPTPLPTVDPVVAASEFYAALTFAIRTTEVDPMIALLHPAVLDRYGEAACRTWFAGLSDPGFDVVVHGIASIGAWEYVTDGVSTTVADAWFVDADITANGETARRELHVAPDPTDGDLRWFTDCGTPLVPGSTPPSAAPSAVPAP